MKMKMLKDIVNKLMKQKVEEKIIFRCKRCNRKLKNNVDYGSCCAKKMELKKPKITLEDFGMI